MLVTWRGLATLVALVTYIAACLVVALVVQRSISAQRPDVLRETWETYRQDFITRDGRVQDNPPLGYGETTSEAQGYAMLRAVWLNDRSTFDRTWQWTQAHLQVRGDSLFGWLWGRDPGGRWMLLSTNTAADADEDIALALVFAGHRWSDQRYLEAGRNVVSDIWEKEVVQAGGAPYLVAGDWAAGYRPQVVANPSYLAPYAYRIFADEDPRHSWAEVVDTSYEVLNRCSWSRLRTNRAVGLPPNWCVLTPHDGTVHTYWDSGGDAYGFDAIRVMWRVALDYQWNHASPALSYLTRSDFLRREWRLHHRLAARYEHDGAADAHAGEEPFAYAGNLGNFVVTDPAAARSIVRDKLLVTLRHDRGAAYWGARNSYYAQNWVWFGVALSEHRLPNLTRSPIALSP